MIQATMVAPGKIVFDDVYIPTINSNEVLIKVMRIGICGSDIHVYHGKHPYTSYPVIQGHEFSGKVVKVGEEVKNFQVGDRVVVQPQVFCGECYPCRTGDYHICDNLKVMGFQTDGWAREYFKVEEAKILKMPDGMNYDEGALVEPVAVACHALRRGEIEIASKNILVLGAGPIGNLVAQAARAKGANKVIITDVSEYRLNLARECGIDVAINVKKTSLEEIIHREFGPDKADLILECVGAQPTITQAINNARKGSNIIIVGVFPDDARVNMGFVQDRELKLIGTLMYKEEDYIEAIDLIASNKIHSDKIITDYFEFGEYDEAYQYIEKSRDKVMKVMIRLAESGGEWNGA